MTKLCPTCLTELHKKQRQCPVCGVKQKRSYKKFSIITASIALPLLLLTGILTYIIQSHSETTMQQKFADALANRDSKTLQKIVMHEDTSAITKKESQAITKLIADLGEVEVEKFFYPVQSNALLPLYKMTAENVSIAPVDAPLQLDDSKMNLSKLVPGKYDVSVNFEDILKSEKTITLQVTAENTKLNADIHYRKVEVFSEEHFPFQAFSNISVEMNGKTTTMEELSKQENFTIFNYKNPKYTIQVDWPWGKTTADKKILVEQIDLTTLPLLSEKQQKDILALLNDTLNALRKDQVNKETTTKYFQKNIPKLKDKEATADSLSLYYLEENNILMKKDGTLAGLSIYSDTANEEVLYAQLTYDKTSKKWFVHTLDGEIFEENPKLAQITEDTYYDPTFFMYDITKMSEAQLKFMFKAFYYSYLRSAHMHDFYDDKEQSKDYDNLNVCFDDRYKKTWVKQVDVINPDEVKITSTDTCVNGESYVATTVLYREDPIQWKLKTIEPRKLIEQ